MSHKSKTMRYEAAETSYFLSCIPSQNTS